MEHFPRELYGSFLLGCVLVDVHGFGDFDRRRTHFAGRLDEDGESAFTKSCVNFMDQLDTLLQRPWDALSGTEQAFVAGYLCHLAADESWKASGWKLWQQHGITNWIDFPVPGDVMLTAFDVLSHEMFLDWESVVTALKDVPVPDVLSHVPHAAFQKMWRIAQPHVLAGGTPQSYFDMLARLGKTSAQVQAVRQEHDLHWENALGVIRDGGGAEPFVQGGVERAVRIVPRLWAGPS